MNTVNRAKAELLMAAFDCADAELLPVQTRSRLYLHAMKYTLAMLRAAGSVVLDDPIAFLVMMTEDK